jgi:Ceramidase
MTIINFDRFKNNFSLHNHRPRVLTLPIFGTLLFSGILFILYKFNQYLSPWEAWRQASGNATNFCELNRFDQLIVQPSNTWSNLGFIIVGLIIISIARNDHKYFERSNVNNLLARYPGFTFLSGFATLYMGLGSFFYHGTLTHAFQKMDQTGMYFVVIAAIAYNIYKLVPRIRYKDQVYSSHKLIIVSAIMLMVLIYTVLWKLPVNITFPALVLLFFFSNFIVLRKVDHSIPAKSFIKATAITLLVSSSIWVLDITNKLCSPTSIFQGHALWHILNAVCIFLMYLYFRSEDYLPQELQAEQDTLA